jgi:hypothetical protein
MTPSRTAFLEIDERIPYVGPEDLRAPVMQGLGQEVDPELAMSIVDVGLAYAMSLEGGKAERRKGDGAAELVISVLIQSPISA